MTTATVKVTTEFDKENRAIYTKYTAGEYRVTVSTRYYGTSKTYVSSVREARIEYRGDYSLEISQFNIGFGEQRPQDDYNEQILRVKADRYSAKTLEVAQANAVDLSETTVQELLKKGKTNSELYGE